MLVYFSLNIIIKVNLVMSCSFMHIKIFHKNILNSMISGENVYDYDNHKFNNVRRNNQKKLPVYF
jgi:hypothetical protein